MSYLRATYEVMGDVKGVEPAARTEHVGTSVFSEGALPERPAWHALAHCGRNGIIGDDPAARVAIMFPRKGANADARRAREVCEGCPVFDECRRAARFTSAMRVGIWAGKSSKERRADPLLRSCSWCGTVMESPGPGQHYCSDPCRDQGRIVSQRRYNNS